MAAAFALMPSPLLGSAVWDPVAETLQARGRTVHVAHYAAGDVAPDAVASSLASQLAGRKDLLLVPHSNAGLYVPGLVAALPGIRAAVFVDAALPDDASSTPVAPPELLAQLRELCGPDGLLPPWSQWWEPAETAGLFPDAATAQMVRAQERRLPLTYFEGEVPAPPGWQTLPSAYVAFGRTYAGERAQAARRGWPVRALSGGHLQMLLDPAGVAATLLELADLLWRQPTG